MNLGDLMAEPASAPIDTSMPQSGRGRDALPRHLIWGPVVLWILMVVGAAMLVCEVLSPGTFWAAGRRPPIWFVLAFQLGALAMLFMFIRVMHKTAQLRRFGQRRTGTITAYRSVPGRNGRVLTFPTLRIEEQPFEGETFDSNRETSPELYPVGSQMPILVNAGDPLRAEIDDPTRLLPGLVVGIPIVAFIFLVVVLVTPKADAAELSGWPRAWGDKCHNVASTISN